MKKLFLDLTGLTKEDWADIRKVMGKFNFDYNTAIQVFMYARPGKIKVLGEMREDGTVYVDEITNEGVKEYDGMEALNKIIEQVKKNKGEL